MKSLSQHISESLNESLDLDNYEFIGACSDRMGKIMKMIVGPDEKQVNLAIQTYGNRNSSANVWGTYPYLDKTIKQKDYVMMLFWTDMGNKLNDEREKTLEEIKHNPSMLKQKVSAGIAKYKASQKELKKAMGGR